MDEVFAVNRAELCGVAAEAVRFSHESRGIRFHIFPLETVRLSGTPDRLNVLVRESMLQRHALREGDRIGIEGELRSFNNKSGVGSRLILTVLARELTLPGPDEDENHIVLTGALCKEPSFRVTPMGREICDVILAVPRRYRRSDYIPVIAWGQQARCLAEAPVGTQLTVRGRLQSRSYTKLVDGQPEQRTAFEVSAADIFAV